MYDTSLMLLTVLNWLIVALAVWGVVNHLWGYQAVLRECNNTELSCGDRILCWHYLRHESTRARVKFYILLAGLYFVHRPILVIDPQYGAWGPIFIRLILLAVLLDLTQEGYKSRKDRTRLAQLPLTRGDEHDAQAHSDVADRTRHDAPGRDGGSDSGASTERNYSDHDPNRSSARPGTTDLSPMSRGVPGGGDGGEADG